MWGAVAELDAAQQSQRVRQEVVQHRRQAVAGCWVDVDFDGRVGRLGGRHDQERVECGVKPQVWRGWHGPVGSPHISTFSEEKLDMGFSYRLWGDRFSCTLTQAVWVHDGSTM